MFPKNQSPMLILGVSAVFMFFILTGCAESDSTPADLAEIEEVIKKDADGLFGIEFVAEEDSSETASVMAKTTDDIIPRAFWRRVKIRRTGLGVTKIGEDTAIAHLTFRMNGYLVILTRVNNQPVRYFKELQHTFQRKVRFVRNPEDSISYWRRESLTPAFGVSDGGTMQLNGPVVIQINRDGVLSTLTISDPLSTYIPFAQLPAWGPGDVIKIEMPVMNATAGDQPVGWAHRGRLGNMLSRLRTSFRDDGQNGDQTAGDGIYTAQWTAVNTTVIGPHIGFVDFFTHSSLFTTDGAYNSIALMFPFIKLAE